jgi:hypothetical protein
MLQAVGKIEVKPNEVEKAGWASNYRLVVVFFFTRSRALQFKEGAELS